MTQRDVSPSRIVLEYQISAPVSLFSSLGSSASSRPQDSQEVLHIRVRDLSAKALLHTLVRRHGGTALHAAIWSSVDRPHQPRLDVGMLLRPESDAVDAERHPDVLAHVLLERRLARRPLDQLADPVPWRNRSRSSRLARRQVPWRSALRWSGRATSRRGCSSGGPGSRRAWWRIRVCRAAAVREQMAEQQGVAARRCHRVIQRPSKDGLVREFGEQWRDVLVQREDAALDELERGDGGHGFGG